MKIIIEIPEKTNAHIRSDYGHGVKGLEYEDMLMLCDAVYHGEPYHNRPHGEWIYHKEWEFDGECAFECSKCGMGTDVDYNFCPRCGSDNRKRGEAE